MKTLAPLLLFAAFYAGAGEESELKVEVQGLRVVAGAPAGAAEGVRAFNASLPAWSSGTAAALLITRRSGGMIQFDAGSSALSKFVDDKGTDLLARPRSGAALTTIGFSLFPALSPDGKYCALEALTPHLPAKGAGQLKLEGVISVLCASQKTEHATKDVPMQKHARIAAPNLELTVSDFGAPEAGVEPFSVTLRALRELDEVAEIRFYKADGTEIASRRVATSKMGILGALTVEWTYNLAERVDAATVKVFLWSDMRREKLGFSLGIDVGL